MTREEYEVCEMKGRIGFFKDKVEWQLEDCQKEIDRLVEQVRKYAYGNEYELMEFLPHYAGQLESELKRKKSLAEQMNMLERLEKACVE